MVGNGAEGAVTELLRERYELLEIEAQGGEGRLFKAIDHQHGRIVALKIRPVGPGGRDELLAEARVLLSLPPHPNLPLVREDFFDGDSYVIVMDWVEGTNLARVLQARGRPGLAPSMVVRWLADAADALTHLHTQNPAVVHGDVKPANLILTTGGRVTLVDFGLSSSPNGPRRRGGTRGYGAPELVSGPPDRRSDVYSLAATAFALLTGAAPTGIRPSWEGIDQALAAELEETIRGGLATDPARRPGTAGELVERLRAGWGSTLPTGVLTFCLTDIDGSAAKWEAHPAEMAQALVAHDELIASAVEEAGGRFLKATGEGDATVSVFTTPGQALRAAVDLARAVSGERVGDEALRARVALHTGEAEQRGHDYVGPALNMAARLRGMADGGQVLLSAATADVVRRHLPSDVTLVDLGPHRLRGDQSVEPVFAVVASGIDSPSAPADCPYPGLLAFGPADRGRFFGREEVVADLVARLGRSRFVAVVGSSGSGKSSLLRSGLAPSIGAVDVMTPGADPLVALARAADAHTLVVDQFEELFTLCGDEAVRLEFIEGLLARRGPVVIGLRADFYGACAGHAGLAAAVAGEQVLLGPMTETELRRAITEPARQSGLRLEPGLVDVLVGEVAGEPGALPLLAHALRATWHHRENRTLTLDGYRATGGVRGAIAATADDVLASLDEAGQDLARHVLLRLVEPGEGTEDTRRRARLDELVLDGEGADRVSAVLDVLATARLVTLGTDGVEVAHEAIIREWPRLGAWVDEERDALRAHRHLTASAAGWDAGGREPSELYRGPRLAAVAEWLAVGPQLSALESAFLAAGREECERDERSRARAHRRLRLLLTGTALGLAAALVAGSLALVQRDRATAARDRADVARLAAVSRSLVERQPDVGLLVAAEASRRLQSAETNSALLAGLEAHPLLEGLLYGVESGLEAAVFTPDGALLVTPTSDGSGTLLWDTATRRRVGALRDGDDIVLGAAVSPDGRWLVAPSVREHPDGPEGRLQVWDLPARRLVRTEPSPGGVLTSAWFSADGRTVVTQGGPQLATPFPLLAVVWDATTWAPMGEPLRLAEAYPGDDVIAVSHDGRLLGVPGPDGTVAVWNVDQRRPLGPPRAHAAEVTALAFGPDGSTLAAGAADGSVTLFDPVTGAARHGPLAIASGVPTAMELSPDGGVLAVASDEGRTQLFDVATGEPLGPALAGSASAITDVSFSPDGTRLATVGVDRTGALWRLDGSRSIGVAIEGHDGPVVEVRYSPDGRLLVSAGKDGRVLVRDTSTNHVRRELRPGAEVLAAVVDHAGRRLAVGGTGGQVRVYDLGTGEPVAALGVDGWVDDLSFNPSTGWLAVAVDKAKGDPAAGDDPGGVIIWDAAAGERIGSPIVAPGGSPIAVAWRPDANQLAVVFDNNVVRLYDGRTHHQVGGAIESVDSPFVGLAFAPDGSRLATGTGGGVVRQWSSTTHRQLGPDLKGHIGPVAGLAYSPDGSMLASTTVGYGTTRLWDAGSGAPIGDELTAGRTPITDRTFTIGQFLGSRPAFSPDGSHLATPGFDGLTTVWDLRPGTWLRAACAVVGRDLTEAEWAQHISATGARRRCSTNDRAH